MFLDSNSNTLLMTLREKESMQMLVFFCFVFYHGGKKHRLWTFVPDPYIGSVLLSNSLLVGWFIIPAVQHVPLHVLEVLGKLLEVIPLDVDHHHQQESERSLNKFHFNYNWQWQIQKIARSTKLVIFR